jgi:hypothetical protein
MRVVGKIQFSVTNQADALQAIDDVVEGWAAAKFQADSDGVAVIRRSKVEALVERRVDRVGDSEERLFDVLEPVDGGDLQTQVRLLCEPGRIHLRCTLSLTSDGGMVAPNVDIFVPRLVRDVVGLPFPWQAGGSAERIFAKSFDVGAGDVDQFIQLTTSPLRTLPLVVVSDLDRRPIAGNLHDRVAADVCGLGHVCRLSKEAAWEVTERLGKEWSCYNGAVRLFWPFRGNRDSPRNHPLWTYDYLTRRGDTEEVVRDRLRQNLRQHLLEASTFAPDVPAFARFAAAKVQAARPIIPTATGASEQRATNAEAEVAELRLALAERDRQIETLTENIAALTTTVFSQRVATATNSATADAPPETVAEAIATAKIAMADRLAFADDLDQQSESLNPNAGPPEKVLRYLNTLADLSTALASGTSIGASIPAWLKDRGVKCSEESETKSANRDARRKRTFSIAGEDVYCELHAKPSDGVSPDQCVRIYFAQTSKAPHILIGYVGRHFD